LELKFFELTQKIVAENNLEIYEMEWHAPSGNLVVFIMNPDTKSAVLEDCEKIIETVGVAKPARKPVKGATRGTTKKK
jgi:ribosome maturation factor RimP